MSPAMRGRMERIAAMVIKEFHQIFRDPRMIRVIFIAPIFQLLVFGYAVSTDLSGTDTFVVDHDGTRASRQLIDAFTAAGYFRIVDRSDRPADMVDALDHGDAVVGLQIPAGFAEQLSDGQGAKIQMLIDGTNSNIATVAQGYAERIFRDHAARFRPDAPSLIDLRERAWFNADLASRNYNVPAVVGALIMLVCLLLTALAVVREREIGTLEQLRVSPVRAGELIAGKTIPFALIGLVDLVVVTVVALAWFGIPFRGSVAILLLASVLYLLSGLGLGLLISTVSSTQQEAFMATFLFFMPAILLSGFMFPVSSMPELFQWMTLANPVRHYMEIVRAVFLKGSGVEMLWPQLVTLLGMGVGLLWYASRRFRRQAAG